MGRQQDCQVTSWHRSNQQLGRDVRHQFEHEGEVLEMITASISPGNCMSSCGANSSAAPLCR